MSSPAEQLQELAARLKAFGVIMRIGHDLFQAQDFQTAAVMSVNNTRPVVGFCSASLLSLQDKRAQVIAQYAQTVTNVHSRQSVMQRDLLELIGKTDESVEICGADAEKYGDGQAVRELCPENISLLWVPLIAPKFMNEPQFRFYWLMEFDGKVPPYAQTAAKLLASNLAEALYCQRIGKTKLRGFGSHFSGAFKLIFWLVILGVLGYVMTLRTPERVNAEFELKAPDETAVYAWFDGPIADCSHPSAANPNERQLWRDGDAVKAGDVIAQYNTEQLELRKASAEASMKVIEAKLELKRKDFDKPESRGEEDQLEAELASAKVTVQETEWYLSHANLTAPCDGVLQLADQRAEALIGKAVRTGDKIFQVLGGDGMYVKIPVNERDASILLRNPSEVTLFLHTMPDVEIKAKVLEISPTPELTEQRTYCYTVLAKLVNPDAVPNLKYGMRGIAKIEGEKVTIGYYLFKSVILYFRGI